MPVTTTEEVEMDNLYREFGTDEELVSIPEYDSPSAGFAGLTDVKVVPALLEENDIRVICEFILPDGDYGTIRFGYNHENPHPFIGRIQQSNHGSKLLSEWLGTELRVSKSFCSEQERERWSLNCVSELYISTWRSVEQSDEDRLVSENMLEAILEREQTPEFGFGEIIDFYVQESSPEITQELEVGLKIKFPDGSTGWFEDIHDTEIPSEKVERILDYLDVGGEIVKTKFKEIPVRFNKSSRSWHIHIPKDTLFGLNLEYRMMRSGYGEWRWDSHRCIDVKKHYAHADNR